jgi:hypothetical protein
MTDDQPIPSAPQCQPDAKNDAAHPDSRAVSEVKVPPSHACYEITCNKKRDKWDIAKLVAEFVGLGFLIAYTIYTAGIYRANERAAQAAQDTLCEIQKQTTLMRQQMVGTQAAVLQFEIHDPDSATWGLAGGVRNVGHLTATDVHLHIEVTQQAFDGKSLRAIGKTMVFDEAIGPIKGDNGTWPEVIWPHVWRVPWIRNPTPNIVFDTWPPDWPGKDISEVKAQLSYQNGFGDTIPKDYCFERLAPGNVKIRNGAMSIGGMYPCDGFIAAIPEVREKWQRAVH